MAADLEVARNWISLQHTEEGSDEYERLFSAWEYAHDLTSSEPDKALEFIVAVLEIEDSTVVQENLSAGPLEDLLNAFGPRVIDQVEFEARKNPKFAKLLGGVWKSGINPDVWVRVQAVWDRRGWDGIPDA